MIFFQTQIRCPDLGGRTERAEPVKLNLFRLAFCVLLVLVSLKAVLGGDVMTQMLLEEIDSIDAEAYKMASSIVLEPQRRQDFAERATYLSERFKHMLAQLKGQAPDLYQSRSDQISETSLDLKFVIAEQKAISLRLHHFIQREKKDEK